MRLFEEWAEKAEDDYKTAVIVGRSRKEPQPDAVCYHCQQSAEKYLKAYLVMMGAVPQRIHDLESLLTECEQYDTILAVLRPAVRYLNPFSVQFRYPGDRAEVSEAIEALKNLRRVRRMLRRKLTL